MFNSNSTESNLDNEHGNIKLLNHNKPDIIIDSSGDKTDFVNDSSTSINNRHQITNQKDNYNFGLLQTSTATGATNKLNPTDSESDLSSETSTSVNYKLQPVKTTPNRLLDKNNKLNKTDLNDSLTKLYLKDDLKISIDNRDWLRKRRPLVADIDLEQHFDKINSSLNEQLIFNANESSFETTDKTSLDKPINKSFDKSLEKSNLMNRELNKENYCNGNIDEHNLSNDKQELDVLSNSSSNHSPNSLEDELDANKIELRSVIRNIMCKNLGSSSDKSSTTMSEEETDEDDENSVDCKAKFNDIKPSIKKKSANSKIESNQDNELNKSKEKANLNKIAINNNLNNDRYDSVDEKEDSDQLNYDSNNSEERTDDLSSKDEDICNSNTDVNENNQAKCSTKSNLKKQFGKNKRRVSFDPLALFLDAALEGELELVKKTATQVKNPSASSEGVTALHNAICAGHFDIVKFLVEIGSDVNAPDNDGWTPLHCAASCNNLQVVKYLVEHGACIFAVTLSDHETPAQKCEEMEDNFQGCSKYLYSKN